MSRMQSSLRKKITSIKLLKFNYNFHRFFPNYEQFLNVFFVDTTSVKERIINNRIMQVMIKTLNHDEEKAKQTNLKTSFSGMIEPVENEEMVVTKTINTNTEHSQDAQSKMNYQLPLPLITESTFSKHERELSSIIGSDEDLQDDDSYATLTVWDFAGDIEYYNTHQTFLNPDAIYLVLANLYDIDDTDSYGSYCNVHYAINIQDLY